MGTQLSLFESIKDLLYLKPLFFWGFAVIIILLYMVFRADKTPLNLRTVAASCLMYYYLCIVLKHIVGVPTIKDLVWRAGIGEAVFHPNISLVPLTGGLGVDFILNIFCFIPLGMLCPVISRAYGRMKKTVLFGLWFSIAIETSQMFTLYRATDSSDLIANVLGTALGWSCFKMAVQLRMAGESYGDSGPVGKDTGRLLPGLILITAFLFTFIS